MNNKLEELKQELFYNTNIRYHYLIIKLLNSGKITKLINKITDTKTKINVDSLQKKSYLTGNEQFLSLLSNFIYNFKEDFYFLNDNFNCIMESLLQSEKYTKFLLCKKYSGNNEYLKYFSFNNKRLIVYGFYNNIKKLSKKSKIINKFINEHKIHFRKNLVNSEQGVELLYECLLQITVCNIKNTNNTLLFEDINTYIKKTSNIYSNKERKLIYNYYIKEWEEMINNYYEKISYSKLLLK